VSTLHLEHGGVLAPSPVEHRVPDHVPAEIAAEHPDAAGVVAREPAGSTSTPAPYALRLVSRGERRTRGALVAAFAACALVAALVPGSDRTRVEAPTTVTARSTTTAIPMEQACPAGQSVVVQCERAPCPDVSPWSWFGGCLRP